MNDEFFAELGIEQAPGDGDEQSPAPASSRRAARTRRTAERARRRRRRRRRAVTALVLIVVLAVVGVVGYKALGIVRDTASSATSVSDYEGPGDADVVVTIPEGSSGNAIGQILVDADVVATVKAFVTAFNANSNAGSIQAGTYTLKTHMSGADAVAALLDPSSRSDHTLTVPEGYTKTQVKERLMAIGGFTSDEVDAAFADTQGIGLPAGAGGDVEGWLAPGTYDVPDDTTATAVVTSMVSQTVRRLTAAGVAEADYETVLTKASIVEREVSTPSYYAQVARVIENRLAGTDGETKGMLQMDSTVLYGLGRTGGMPTSQEIADSSNAYNTYQHAGLPPGPIGSPGEAALTAVVSPADGNWLYFVTVNLSTGETLFAATLEEQKANTAKLTAYCKENPTVCSGGTAPSSTGSGSGDS